ncbi:MAG: oligopeptide transporter permease, partial [Hyphomicrobiales bacterium]|nr:oligopeptide transporter permease [Hyphomicrobiales bacterium]
MWSYALRRVLATVPTLLAVITVCYLLLHATPGGPFDEERKVSAAV